MVSIERIMEYTKTEQEAPWEDTKKLENWPNKGNIQFLNYQTKYRWISNLNRNTNMQAYYI